MVNSVCEHFGKGTKERILIYGHLVISFVVSSGNLFSRMGVFLVANRISTSVSFEERVSKDCLDLKETLEGEGVKEKDVSNPS